MTSRERVLAAINHEEPDRVPVDLGSTPSSGISAVAYDRLKQHLGVASGRTRIYDVVQYLAQPEDAILERFGVDVIDVGRAFNDADEAWHDTVMPNGRDAQYPVWFNPREDDGTWNAYHEDGTRLATMPQGAVFFDQTCCPWIDGYPEGRAAMDDALDEAMDHVMWAKFAPTPWDRAGEDGFWDTLRATTLRLRETSDKALLLGTGSNLFEWGTFLRRMDNFLMDLYTDSDNVSTLMELLMERHMAALEKVCEAVGDIVDIAKDGDDIVFWGGGVDSRETLNRGTPEQVRDDVLRRLDIFAPGGGYVFNTIHNVLAEVPPENVVACFDAVRKSRP